MKKLHFMLCAASVIALAACKNAPAPDASQPEAATPAADTVATPAPDDDSAAVSEADERRIAAFLKRIYTPSGTRAIFEDEWVMKHCSSRMQKMLRDEYDYEGEGWASWIIGGWGEGEDAETRVADINTDGRYFYVVLSPDGYSRDVYKGKRTLRFDVSLVDGTPVIDDCKWTTDFEQK